MDAHERSTFSSPTTTEIPEIQTIIDRADLSDLGFSGNKFTWSNRQSEVDCIYARLDMALGNGYLLNQYGSSRVHHIDTIGSDHIPIILETNPLSYQGSKPYKYFKCWSSDPSVREIISNAYSKEVRGSSPFQLTNKLRFIKHDLKLWNNQHFGNINNKVKYINSYLNDLTNLPHSPENVELIKQVEFDLDHWQKVQEDFYAQKSRQEYFRSFDRNTGYYHNYANRRKHFNHISALKLDNGQWVNERADLETLLINHFSSIGTTSNPYRNVELLNCIDPCISDIDNLNLLRPVTKQEIVDTINQMTPWTAPGPDGFPPGFYKENIDLLINDLWKTVNSFFESKHLFKEMNHTFLSLIQKTDNPSSPSEFRPISLCNSSYKIISKIIVNRMKPLLSKMISPYQAAYVPTGTYMIMS
ncbi:uncharacterized protein LOC113312852 [Papaver somniferum]|uniref:uncharacterized protein LOC113312852 n=1 Tax=Papaver somniferum TaxID=3469 RepID=UPI000E6FD393|nr:uncharacterized protein LOC113312852 [Papaver somniferum]